MSLESHVRNLEDYIEDADAYERRDTIIIIAGRNLPVSLQGENCGFLVQRLLTDHLSFEVETSDINTTHRLGARKANPSEDS